MKGVPKWVLAVAAIVVVVAAADAAVFELARGGAPSASAEPTGGAANTVAVIDPARLRVVASVPVGRQPTSVATGFGGVWVLNKGDGTLTRIEPRSRSVIATIEPDVAANALAVGAGGVWLVGHPNGNKGTLEDAQFERIDPATGAVDRSFLTKTGAQVVAAGGRALWTTGYIAPGVRGAARSDAATGAFHKVDIEIYGDLVAASDRAVYYVGSIGERAARVSTHTSLLTDSMTLATDASLAAGVIPPNPTGVAIGAGSIWISETNGSVLRIDPYLKGIVASVPACDNALAVAYGAGAVWVACGNRSVVRIDAGTDIAGAPIPVPRLPRGIAAGEGAVWVTLN
jgi:YVTN family beta-propeller protein